MEASASDVLSANELKLMDIELKRTDDDNELVLAEQLQRLCDKHGRETDRQKSALLLHKLGKIYHKRSPRDFFSLIRSAALYNAAIVRSPKNKNEIKNDLQLLCKHILVVADAANKDADLIEQAKTVKEAVQNLRGQLKERLKEIKPIPEDIEDDKLNSLELNKISYIQTLQDDIANDYTQIMADVSNFCEGVMGPAPCEFAVAGMGSLARKEITLYSDFEHIILLENFVKNTTTKDYEKCLHYFRWFTTIFQIVIINLGETIIDGLAIPTLNDPSTEAKYWFDDAFTMRGISFDFMMPHASHFPLGRRQFTENKPWMTELIRPIDEMLKYLSSEESLKNGYHLNDILTKTCFVYKNKQLFDEFHQKVFDYLETEERNESVQENVKKQLIEDLERFAAKSKLAEMKPNQKFDVKHVFYRSITLLIMAMEKIYNIHASSCFEILTSLAEIKQISESAKDKLMYAVALACEIRMKWYSMNNSQRDDIPSIADLQKLIGNISTVRYFQIVYALQCDVSKRLELKKVHFYSNLNLLNLSIGYCLEDYHLQETSAAQIHENSSVERLYNFDECLKLLTRKSERFNSSITKERNGNIEIQDSLALCYQNLGNNLNSKTSLDDAIACYKTSMEILCNLKKNVNEAAESYLYRSLKSEGRILFDIQIDRDIAVTLCKIGGSLVHMYRFEEAMRHFEKSLENFERLLQHIKTDYEVAETLSKIGNCLVLMNKLEEAKSHLERSLEIKGRISPDINNDRGVAVTLEEIGGCLLLMDKLGEAKNHLERALEIKERISLDIKNDLGVAATLDVIGQCLVEMDKLEAAKSHLEKSLEIKQRRSLDIKKDYGVGVTLKQLGHCLVQTNELEEAKSHLERSLEIQKQISLDIKTDRDVAMILMEIGSCLVKMNKLEKANNHLERSLEIFERISHDIKIDRSLAATLNKIGECLVKMNKLEAGKRHLERSLEIKERISLDIATDHKIAITLYEIGYCMMEMNQFEEAKRYLERSLEIRERRSLDTTIDPVVAITLFKLGQCLVEMNKFEEAKSHLERSLEIKQRISLDIKTDREVANSLQVIGCCLMKMNKFEKASSYWDRSLAIIEGISLDIKTDHSVALTLFNFGSCLMKTNKLEEATFHLERSLDIFEQISHNAKTDPEIAINLQQIGSCLLEMKKYEAAKRHLDRSLEIKERLPLDIKFDRDVAVIQHMIGICLVKMNNFEEAQSYLEKSLEIRERISLDIKTDPEIAIILKQIGHCLRQMNKFEEAKNYLERSSDIIKQQKFCKH